MVAVPAMIPSAGVCSTSSARLLRSPLGCEYQRAVFDEAALVDQVRDVLAGGAAPSCSDPIKPL